MPNPSIVMGNSIDTKMTQPNFWPSDFSVDEECVGRRKEVYLGGHIKIIWEGLPWWPCS